MVCKNVSFLASTLMLLATITVNMPAQAQIEQSFPDVTAPIQHQELVPATVPVTTAIPQTGVAAEPTAVAVPASFTGLKQVIPNYGQVSNTLLRGGQPSYAGFQALKDAGVKTIINLRDGKDDIQQEQAIASELGLKFVSIPLSVFKGVQKSQTEKFLSVVNKAENQPVFVHCRQGQDRCSTMVAMYRLHNDSWAADRAYKEMISYGFHPMFVGLRGAVFGTSAELGRPVETPPNSEIVDDLRARAKKVLSMI
jgi:tyrosine-protein phosphatase SIW14